MVAASKATNMSRQAARKARTDSPIATLAGRATPASAGAPVETALRTGPNFTGQYLFDTFVNDTLKHEASKMDIVRSMVKALDTASFKKVLADFVDIAKSYHDKAINAAKQAGTYDKDAPTAEIEQATARLKTSRNHQTVIRIAYGAYKFAPEELAAHGGDDTTGYQLMRVIGAKALADKKLNWDGSKAEPKESREARRAQEAETKTMLEIQREHPKGEKESRTAYLDRIMKLTDTAMETKRAEATAEQIKALVAKVRELTGPLIEDVLDVLLTNPQNDAVPAADTNLH